MGPPVRSSLIGDHRHGGGLRLEPLDDGVFELGAGRHLDFYAVHGLHVYDLEFAQVEAGDRGLPVGAPVAHALIAVFALFDFFAGGHQLQFPGPMESHVKRGKLPHAPDMWKPDAAVADKIHAVARIADHTPSIGHLDAIGLTRSSCLREKYEYGVIAALRQLIFAQRVVLEKIERVAIGILRGLHE